MANGGIVKSWYAVVSRYVRVIKKANNIVDETLWKKNRMYDKRWNDACQRLCRVRSIGHSCFSRHRTSKGTNLYDRDLFKLAAIAQLPA